MANQGLIKGTCHPIPPPLLCFLPFQDLLPTESLEGVLGPAGDDSDSDSSSSSSSGDRITGSLMSLDSLLNLEGMADMASADAAVPAGVRGG